MQYSNSNRLPCLQSATEPETAHCVVPSASKIEFEYSDLEREALESMDGYADVYFTKI